MLFCASAHGYVVHSREALCPNFHQCGVDRAIDGSVDMCGAVATHVGLDVLDESGESRDAAAPLSAPLWTRDAWCGERGLAVSEPPCVALIRSCHVRGCLPVFPRRLARLCNGFCACTTVHTGRGQVWPGRRCRLCQRQLPP